MHFMFTMVVYQVTGTETAAKFYKSSFESNYSARGSKASTVTSPFHSLTDFQ